MMSLNKRYFFVIILLTLFGSAFAVEYDPTDDVISQFIGVLVPTLIVAMFDRSSNAKPKPKNSQNTSRQPSSDNSYADSKQPSSGNSHADSKQPSSECSHDDNSKQTNYDNSHKDYDSFGAFWEDNGLKVIKQVFDDFLVFLSIFALPPVVFFKNRDEYGVPLWIPILFIATSGIVLCSFPTAYWVYIAGFPKAKKNDNDGKGDKGHEDDKVDKVDKDDKDEAPSIGKSGHMLSSCVLHISHIVSDICFIFYTRALPQKTLSTVFIYLHSVTGVLCALVLVLYLLSLRSPKPKSSEPTTESTTESSEKSKNSPMAKLRRAGLIIPFIWTPLAQMFNMALLSGNDYYWTKVILALNMITFSRIVNYLKDDCNLQFGVTPFILHSVHEEEVEIIEFLYYKFFKSRENRKEKEKEKEIPV